MKIFTMQNSVLGLGFIALCIILALIINLSLQLSIQKQKAFLSNSYIQKQIKRPSSIKNSGIDQAEALVVIEPQTTAVQEVQIVR